MTSLCTLILALWAVESEGAKYPPPGALGEVGPLQIRPILVDDLNRLGHSFTYADRHDLEKSKAMCRIYLAHYATRQRIGREPTAQDMARIWNGGPRGWRKPSTLPYWRKVRHELNKNP